MNIPSLMAIIISDFHGILKVGKEARFGLIIKALGYIKAIESIVGIEDILISVIG